MFQFFRRGSVRIYRGIGVTRAIDWIGICK